VGPTDEHLDTALRLGRGLLVAPGGPVPDPWHGAPRVRIDDSALRNPNDTARTLHEHWARRVPQVVEIAVDPDELRAPERDDRPPYALTPSFEFARERCYFLARSNNYDHRRGTLVWGPAIEAVRLGATPADDADIRLPDGRLAWCDGGPRAAAAPVPPQHELVHRVRIDEGDLTPDRDAPPPATLAPDQTAAVAHDAGPARIIAPAGSGKTRVLTERFRLLVAGRGWGSGSVCAVAYNVRAKDEMQSRLGDLTGADRRKVRTLHALGYDIVRRATPRADVVDERDVRNRIEALVPVRRRANTDVYAPYLEALGAVRLGLVHPEKVEAERDDVEGFAAMFDRYRTGLHRDGVLDHDEQVYGAIEVLLQRPDTRRELQRECRHLLVDEFQDLTPAQLLLIRLVAAPSYDVFGVGDDDQVIYGYAGADPDFLIRYDHYFPAAATHDLEVNYRCPPEVVDHARTLLTWNRRRVPKQIRAARTEPLDAVHVDTAPAADLARTTVAHVQEWLTAAAPRDVAALARVNAALLPVQVMLTAAGIPCWTPVTMSVLDRTGVRAALAYLRIANALAAGSALDGRDVAVAARRPPRSVPPQTLDRIARRRWTLDALAGLGATLTGRAADRFDDFCGALARLHSGRDTAALLTQVRDEIGLGGALETLDRSGRGPDGSHLDDLNALIAVAALQPDPVAFEPWLRDQLPRTTRADPNADEVALSTVHRVKGMEWPYVAVLGAHDGLMPHVLADDVEEERRIFHVAITRARTEVRIVVQDGKRTPFVDQMRAPASDPKREERRAAPVGTEIEPVVGMELTFAGATGVIAELRLDGVLVAEPAGAKMLVRYGERVEVDGRRARLARPDLPVPEADNDLVTALKAWRLERARRDGVPAYVVLHDSHIEEIARRAPATLRELASCPGIGPTKLDRYGDEILAIVDAAGGI